MKNSILILILLFPLILNGQIRVFFKIDNYSDIPVDSFKIGVNITSIDYKYKFEEYNFSGDTGSIIIPHNKSVFCVISYYRNDLVFNTDIFPTFMFENKLRTKEIIIPAYKLGLEISDFWNSKYYYNNVLCNGLITDYYKNGNKRIEGRFKNGKARKLKYYNEQGLLEKTERINKQGFITKKT